MYRKFYTLVTGKFPDERYFMQDGRVKEFGSFEEAYDVMCKEYLKSLKASCEHPSGLPVRYGILVTTESDGNSMTQPTWAV
jgi:hypothetical protein